MFVNFEELYYNLTTSTCFTTFITCWPPYTTSLKKTPIHKYKYLLSPLCVSLAETLQELISSTMIHWAQESFIQNPELVRLMFSLLHRQYDSLGELIRAVPKAYTINVVSVQDTMELLECLSQIRSLLIVQMGPEEERLMIQSIGLVADIHSTLH